MPEEGDSLRKFEEGVLRKMLSTPHKPRSPKRPHSTLSEKAAAPTKRKPRAEQQPD